MFPLDVLGRRDIIGAVGSRQVSPTPNPDQAGELTPFVAGEIRRLWDWIFVGILSRVCGWQVRGDGAT